MSEVIVVMGQAWVPANHRPTGRRREATSCWPTCTRPAPTPRPRRSVGRPGTGSAGEADAGSIATLPTEMSRPRADRPIALGRVRHALPADARSPALRGFSEWS